jgi:hypothetical protein
MIYVVFRDERGRERWEVLREGDDRPLSAHQTQAAAVEAALATSKTEGADLVVQDRFEAVGQKHSSEYHMTVNEVEYRTLIYAPGERTTPLREFRTSSALPLRSGTFYVHVLGEGGSAPKRAYRIRAVMVDLYSEPTGRVMHTTSVYTEAVDSKGRTRGTPRRK